MLLEAKLKKFGRARGLQLPRLLSIILIQLLLLEMGALLFFPPIEGGSQLAMRVAMALADNGKAAAYGAIRLLHSGPVAEL